MKLVTYILLSLYLINSSCAKGQTGKFNPNEFKEIKRYEINGHFNIVYHHKSDTTISAVRSYADSLYSQLVMEYFLIAGIKNGPWTSYNIDGSVYRQGNYKNGKQDGITSTFESNRLVKVARYKDGLENGKWEFYDSSGKLEVEMLYEDGVLKKTINHKEY